MFCQFCGSEVAPDQNFCPRCGRAQQASAPAGGAPPPFAAPTAFTPPAAAKARIGDWIGQGWHLVTSDLWTFVLMALVFIVLSSVVPMILQGPVTAGLQIACMKKLFKGRTDINDLFKGFNFFVQTLVASILIGVFVGLGSLLCIIPGLVLAAMYQFTFLLIVDKKMEFWPAMQASHAIIKQDYLGFTLFVVVLGLVNVLGALCCVVGLLVTIPVHFAAVTCAYKDLVGFEQTTVDMV